MVRALAEWCQNNNLSNNVSKTKELIVDFRKQQREYALFYINATAVENVKNFPVGCLIIVGNQAYYCCRLQT